MTVCSSAGHRSFLVADFSARRSVFRLLRPCRLDSGRTLRLPPTVALAFPTDIRRPASRPLDPVSGQQLMAVVQQRYVFVGVLRGLDVVVWSG